MVYAAVLILKLLIYVKACVTYLSVARSHLAQVWGFTIFLPISGLRGPGTAACRIRQ